MHDSPAADSAQEQRTRADALPSVLPAWAQAALTSPSQEGFMEVQGAKIHYITWGSSSKPPLVLVHGNAASAEWWRFIAPLLADDHYVIAPDLAGMGDSEHTGQYEREIYAEQVMAVADALSPRQKPVIIGHSLGGFVAIMAACAHGERLGGLIVLDSPPHDAGRDGIATPFVRANPVPRIYPDRESAMARFKLMPAQDVNCGFYLRHIAGHAVKPEGGGWRWKFDPAALAQPRRAGFVQDLLDMPCPTALMWGALSSRFDPAERERCQTSFAGTLPMVEIPNARHHIMLDEPLALVAALRAQLANWALLHGTGTALAHKK